jgi:hypothetical protein
MLIGYWGRSGGLLPGIRPQALEALPAGASRAWGEYLMGRNRAGSIAITGGRAVPEVFPRELAGLGWLVCGFPASSLGNFSGSH